MSNSIKFAVAVDQPVRGDIKRYKYASAEAAEAAARRFVKGQGGEISIWLNSEHMARGNGYPNCIATVLKDSLGRVWTQVTAGPGQQALL